MKPLLQILLLALVALSIYFIFLGEVVIGIVLLIVSSLFEYRLARAKKPA